MTLEQFGEYQQKRADNQKRRTEMGLFGRRFEEEDSDFWAHVSKRDDGKVSIVYGSDKNDKDEHGHIVIDPSDKDVSYERDEKGTVTRDDSKDSK